MGFSNLFRISDEDIPEPELVPERQLVASVLAMAIHDLCMPTLTDSNYNKDAIAWLRNNSTKEFSFLWCCTVLNLDSQSLRKYIRESNPVKLYYLITGKKGQKTWFKYLQNLH